MATPSFSIDPEGDGYKLSRVDAQGRKAEMFLSDENVMSLALSADTLKDHVLAKHKGKAGAHPPVAVILVSHLELNADIHEAELHLTMVAKNGARSPAYSLPSDVARDLLNQLPEWVATLEKAKPQH